MAFDIQVVAWDRHKKVTLLNCLMVSQPSSFDKLISNGDTDTNKRRTQICPNSKIPHVHTITKMSEDINMDRWS